MENERRRLSWHATNGFELTISIVKSLSERAIYNKRELKRILFAQKHTLAY